MTTFLELAERHGLTWPVRTARLTLAPFRPADLAEAWEYVQSPEITLWTTQAFASEAEVSERWGNGGYKLAVRENSGRMIGDCGLRVESAWSQAEVEVRARDSQGELNWAFDPRYWGRGYATETATALIDVAFSLGLRRVTAQCFAANVGSWKLMERLGMRRETYAVKESLHRDLGWQDSMGYALLAEEWRGGSTVL